MGSSLKSHLNQSILKSNIELGLFGRGERNDLECRNCTGSHFADFKRNRIILNEFGIAYFFAPRMSVLGSVLWYDASNLPNGS